jgi:hypothetical protein
MRKTLLACCTVVALAGFMAAPGVYADPPPGKGKGADKSQQSGSDVEYAYPEDAGGKGGKNGKGNNDERGNDNDQHGKSGDVDNHGQRVSECNHRANERKLQGRDRKEFVDWCIAASATAMTTGAGTRTAAVTVRPTIAI